MLANLSLDIWIHIIDKHGITKNDLANLSSIGKAMRQIMVPTLFRSLTFSSDDIENFPDILDYVPAMQRAIKRVGFFLNNRQYLPHTRRVALRDWGSAPEIIESDAGDDPQTASLPSSHQLAMSIWTSAYSALESLLEDLPQLGEVTIWNSPITDRLHTVFFSKTTLKALYLDGYPSVELPHLATTQVYGSFLHTLRLEGYADDIAKKSKYDQYYSSMLASYARTDSIQNLGIPSSYLPSLRITTADRLLQIQQLSIFSSIPGDHSTPQQKSGIIQEFLTACPNLRSLEVDTDSDFLSISLPSDALPKLETVAADAALIWALVPGRPVHTVRFVAANNRWTDIASGLFHLQQSTVAITDLDISSSVQRINNNMLLQVAHTVKTLTHLHIPILKGFKTHKPELALRFILPSLSFFPALRLCDFGAALCDWGFENIMTYSDRSVPISERGHPSLELVQLSSVAWIWYGGEGWGLREIGNSGLDYN